MKLNISDTLFKDGEILGTYYNPRRTKPEKITTSSYRTGKYTSNFNPDNLLSDKSETLDLYKKMNRTSTVHAAIQLRKDIALAVDWDIKAEEDDKDSVFQADFVKEVFNNLQTIPFLDFLENMLDYEWLGFIVAEPQWVSDSNYWVYYDLKCKDSSLFTFKIDDYGNLEYLTPDYGTTQILLHDVILGVYPYLSNGNWYGTSCLQSVYTEWWARENIIKFRNMYLQNRGSAPLQGIYNSNDSNAKAAVEAIMNSIQNDYWTSIPGFMGPDGELKPKIAVKLLETASSAGTSEFETAVSQLDTSITRGLLLPDNLGFTDTHSGSYAQAQVEMKAVIFGLKKRLAKLEDVINRQVIDRLLTVNFERPARVRLKFEELIDDLTESKARVIDIIVKAGVVDKGEKFIRSYLGLPETREYLDGEELTDVAPEQETGTPDEEIDDAMDEGGPEPEKKESFAEGKRKRPDYKAIKAELDRIEGAMLEQLAPAFDAMTSDYVAKAIKDVIEPVNLAGLDNIELRKQIGTIKVIFTRGLTEAYLYGRATSGEEMKSFTNSNVMTFAEFSDIDFSKLGYKGVDAWLKKYGTKLRPVDKKQLANIAKIAYSIAGDDIAGALQTKLRQIIRTGLGTKTTAQIVGEMQSEISKFYNQAITDPAVPVSIQAGLDKLPVGRIRTIVRNNSTTQFNQGRSALALDPDLQGFVVAARYSAVMDDATTPFCEAHNGEIVEIDSPDYVLLTPPNHHNCRSTWEYLYKGDDYDKTWNTKTDEQLEDLHLGRNEYDKGQEGFGKP